MLGWLKEPPGPTVPLIWSPTLPSSSNWLTLEEVPPASISIMISKPIVTLGLTLALPRKLKRLDELVLSRP